MKRILFLFSVIFLVVLIINLFFSVITLWSKKDVLTQARLTLAQKQQKHEELVRDLAKVQDPSFVEEQARNKLFLGKPGESLVIFPSSTPSAIPVAGGTNWKPAWQQWWELFF